MTITKHIQIQISGDNDAIDAAIVLLHSLNFINGSIWSQAIQKKGQKTFIRFADRTIDVP